MWFKKRFIPAILVCGFCFSCMTFAAAQTADDAEATPPNPEYGGDFWTRKHATGDWGGLRSNLSEHGIDVGLRLSQYWQRVATGGKTQNDEYGGTVDYRVNVDWGKLFGAQGWSLNIHTRTRFGEDISADVGAFVLENAGLLTPIPGDYHDTDVTGLMLTKAFPFGGKHIAAISVGKIDVIDTATGFFPGLGYGQEGFWNANSSITALPWFGAVAGLSLYGGYMVTLNTEYGMLPQSGLLVTGTENVSDNWGSVSDSFDDVWVAGFHRFLWKMGEKPGFFMIFGGYSTREQPSNDPLDFIGVPGQGIVSTDEGNPWDVALYLTQDLWHAEGNPQRKVVFLAGGTLGPDNPQFAQWNFFANVEAHGVMNSRPNDSMGVAFHRNALSDNFIDLVSPVIELQDVWGFEFYYNIAINKWLHLTADVQFVETEVKDNDFALIPGVRLVIDL